MNVDADVIIVGAGLAGLYAAREIRKHAPKLKVRVDFFECNGILLFVFLIYKFNVA
jgi:flavin-dependent dehydrogenase